jgi:signal peptide peptidase SppA
MKPTPQLTEHISLPRISRSFYFEPIALEESAMLSVHQYLWPRVTGQIAAETVIAAASDPNSVNPSWAPHVRRSLPAEGYYSNGSADPRYYWSIDGREDIAVIPINGMIIKGATFLQEMCMGAVSTERISFALDQAMAAKEIKNIVFDMNSPGGVVTGIAELGNKVAAAAKMRGKTVYAFTDSMAASAMYWVASQANEIHTTGSAQLGSIGTYLAFLNEKVSMQMKGVSLELFKAGTHKGLGLPGNDLTQADRSYLQARVDDLNTQFTSAVKAARPKISEDAITHAAMYPGISSVAGASSLDHRLADGLHASWEDFIALI